MKKEYKGKVSESKQKTTRKMYGNSWIKKEINIFLQFSK